MIYCLYSRLSAARNINSKNQTEKKKKERYTSNKKTLPEQLRTKTLSYKMKQEKKMLKKLEPSACAEGPTARCLSTGGVLTDADLTAADFIPPFFYLVIYNPWHAPDATVYNDKKNLTYPFYKEQLIIADTRWSATVT
ncbi:hypothetical protein TNIN_258331 [Trichonephila inaurata madagascariensis]|uniref:Uncharacterized protein n=1 Tax=Trichonephila inaurata madagascariensis TaxID=2747483 RepID=A0A8X6KMF1_9ARAC|nr:hypothetical protein TNIN_258331 [Trichonephila inaurata madagascariensis]